MALSMPNCFLLHHKLHLCSPNAPSASLHPPHVHGLKIVAEAKSMRKLCYDHDATKEKIKKMFEDRVELSISSYDTAWVAMVPSPSSSENPCFPECLDWLLNNQLKDGSWGVFPPLLIKDALSSTLAGVLALKRWGVGEEQMHRGLNFIESNFESSTDGDLRSPIGFDIIFPGMLEYAKDLNLDLNLRSSLVDTMLYKRDSELKSLESKDSFLAYVSEGLGKYQKWEQILKYQNKNGSLFNSPATTAAALIHLQNPGCLNYLRLVLNIYGNAVPTVYPLDIFVRLCMVDNLARLGIERHFRKEIETVLEMAYRSWVQKEDELFSDITTCAMAFRILRMHGYDISSDPFNPFLGVHLKDEKTALELYKVSQMIIYTDESALEKTHSWSSNFLKQFNKSSGTDEFTEKIGQEVDYALKVPFYANLARFENRRAIKHYDIDNTIVLKTSYRSPNISNECFLKLAVEDFNMCQSIHREELEDLKRWIVENKLDQLKFSRQKLTYAHFSTAAVIFTPEQSDSRISWVKNGVLATVVDDFFDVAGTEEELNNLVNLVERWEDVNKQTDCCSEKVEVIFSALHSTICELGDKASALQGRCVTKHFVKIWLELMKSMRNEAEWTRTQCIPTMNEYLTNGNVSFAMGPVLLPAVYLVGPKLSDEVMRSPELYRLLELTSICGRLLNDIVSIKRETEEGKLNAISLRVIHGNGDITEEEAVEEMRRMIQSNRRELLGLVFRVKDSVVPRACKDLFWEMSRVLHFFYSEKDGYSMDNLKNYEDEVLHEPIVAKDLVEQS